MKKVLLTPVGLWREENDKVVAILIRDPDTEEIVDEAVTGEALAEKTGMSSEKARQIFQEAYAALERRVKGKNRGTDVARGSAIPSHGGAGGARLSSVEDHDQ